MKSIREWFEGTGEPLRSNLLRNMNPARSTVQVCSLSSAILCGLILGLKAEGQEYWWGVYDCLRSKGE